MARADQIVQVQLDVMDRRLLERIAKALEKSNPEDDLFIPIEQLPYPCPYCSDYQLKTGESGALKLRNHIHEQHTQIRYYTNP